MLVTRVTHENGSSTEQGLWSPLYPAGGRCPAGVKSEDCCGVDGGGSAAVPPSECFSFHLPFTGDFKNDKAARFGVNVNTGLRLK